MKIQLIQPKSDPMVNRIVMPIGLASIASVLRDEGHEVVIIDEDIGQRPSMKGIDVTGVSINMSSREKRSREIMRKISSGKIVAGGQHAAWIDLGEIHVIRGEGENEMLKFVGSPVKNFTIETLPLAAYDLLDVEKYFKLGTGENPFSPGKRVIQYETSRGCNFSCKFCVTKKFWGTWRGKSPGKVVDELSTLKEKFGFDEANFVDANLLMDKNRAKRMFEMIASELPGIKCSNPGGIWTRGLDDELIDIMCDAGFYQFTFPIETTHERWIEEFNMKPKLDHSRLPELTAKCHQRGARVHAFLIAGFPGETISDVEKDLAECRKAGIDSVSIHMLVKFPGLSHSFESPFKSYYDAPFISLLEKAWNSERLLSRMKRKSKNEMAR